jgi:hypothetical protein
VLEASDGKSLELAALVGQEVIGLPCMARDYRDLERAKAAMPPGWQTGVRGSVVFKGKRVVVVFLSRSMSPNPKVHVTINRRISISAWPTDQDVLCLYGPPDSGNTGQVENTVVRWVTRNGAAPGLYGTARVMSVVLELLVGKNVCAG